MYWQKGHFYDTASLSKQTKELRHISICMCEHQEGHRDIDAAVQNFSTAISTLIDW